MSSRSEDIEPRHSIMGEPRDIDTHALQTNLMANVVILLSASLSLLVCLFKLARRASMLFQYPARCDWIIVPGHALECGYPSADFRVRLDRAADLARRAPEARILILGGVATGQTRSEAEAGRDHLHELGIVPGRVVLEYTSRNTLENFQRALPLLRESHDNALVLVTNRYHLARCETLARNLGLDTALCPAEIERMPGLFRIRPLLWEAYLLHWYHVGRIYATATGNKAMLTRIFARKESD